MLILVEELFPECIGMSNEEKYQYLIDRGISCERGMKGPCVVLNPDVFQRYYRLEWRQLECWPELRIFREEYYEGLPLLKKIIWKIKEICVRFRNSG